jgi:hypothetical protein
MFKHLVKTDGPIARIVAALLIVVFASWSGIGAAQEQWAQLSSPQSGFEALFPKTPTETQVTPNQRNFLADLGSTAYIVSVVENVPANQNWEKLVEACERQRQQGEDAACCDACGPSRGGSDHR